MYDVANFIVPVKKQYERSIDLINQDEHLTIFRQSRNNSPIGERMREYLNMNPDNETNHE